MAETTGLLNLRTLNKGTEGSNPSLSANQGRRTSAFSVRYLTSDLDLELWQSG